MSVFLNLAILSHGDCPMMLNNLKMCLLSIHMPFLCEVSLRSFTCFWFVLILLYKFHLYILDTNPLSDIVYKYFLSFCEILYCFLTGACRKKKKNLEILIRSGKVQLYLFFSLLWFFLFLWVLKCINIISSSFSYNFYIL